MKKKTKFEDLERYIHMHNEFYRIVSPVVEKYKEISKAFIGKKIETQSGLTVKFAELFEGVKLSKENTKVKPFPGWNWAYVHRCYLSVDFNMLKLNIAFSFQSDVHGGIYKEHTFYFGKVKNCILESIDENCRVGEDFELDYETELQKIKTFIVLREKADSAKDEINAGSETYKYLSAKDFD